MAGPHVTRETNRNGLVGDFEAFRPRGFSLEEFIAEARATQAGQAAEPRRESRELLREGGYALVRYRINSAELVSAMDALGGERFVVHSERHGCSAVFGVVGPDGMPRAVLDVIDDPGDGGMRVSFLFARPDHGIPNGTMLRFMREIDVPASWRAGADNGLRDRFDLAWDEAAGTWMEVAPVHLVKVAYRRTCFATRPTLEERLDVMLLPVEGQDLGDADADKAYWARDHYRHAGFEELHRLVREQRPRPGFSSWMADGEPGLVKVVNDYLDAEIARLRSQAEADAPEEDGPGEGHRFGP